jgi:hypothetical protein
LEIYQLVILKRLFIIWNKFVFLFILIVIILEVNIIFNTILEWNCCAYLSHDLQNIEKPNKLLIKLFKALFQILRGNILMRFVTSDFIYQKWIESIVYQTHKMPCYFEVKAILKKKNKNTRLTLIWIMIFAKMKINPMIHIIILNINLKIIKIRNII